MASAASTASSAPQVTSPRLRIAPPPSWRLLNARELWQYRELLYFLIWREVKVRYKQTWLGAAWAILQPVLMMIMLSIFLGRMAGLPTGEFPYPIFVFAGLLPWTYFATTVSNAANSVVMSEKLITKIYFPRLALPIASAGAALVDLAIAQFFLIGMMLWYGIAPGPGVLLVPFLLLLLTLAALGVGAFLAALNVSYRDFRYVLPFLMQLWLFATPTVYMQVDTVTTSGQTEAAARGWEAAARLALHANPLSDVIAGLRAALLGGPLSLQRLFVATLACGLVFVLGCLYFRRVEAHFADVI